MTETNQTHSDPLLLIGCSWGATGKLRARARARAQTGLLYIELLVCACGHRATKNAGDTAVRARALKGRVLRKKRKCYTPGMTLALWSDFEKIEIRRFL